MSLPSLQVNVASIFIPAPQSIGETANTNGNGHHQSFAGAINGLPSLGNHGKSFKSREEKEEEEAQERRMRRREEEERRRERELFLSGKATPPPAMVCHMSQKVTDKNMTIIVNHRSGANGQTASNPGKNRSHRREKRQEEVVR